MSDQKVVKYTPEDLLSAAQGNWNGLVFATMAFFREQKLSPVDLWHFAGSHFTKFWPKDIDALGMAEGSAINWVSIGAKLVETRGDAAHSTLVISEWPPIDLVKAYGFTTEEADLMSEIMRPIAASLGFDYEWRREGDRLIQVYTKK